MLFCYLWRNFEASCRKHFVVVSREQHTLLTSSVCHGRCRCVYNTCRSNRSQHMMKQILVENLFFCLPVLHSSLLYGVTASDFAKMFDSYKTRMIGLPCGEETTGCFKKTSPHKTSWNIFTSVKSFCIKFCKFVGNSYAHISAHFLYIHHEISSDGINSSMSTLSFLPCQVLRIECRRFVSKDLVRKPSFPVIP